MTENWRAVPGFAGIYDVSDLGNIRSLHGRHALVLKQSLNTAGYPMVTLSREGHKISHSVHRLVCEAFNGPPNALHTEVAHLDGTRLNNVPRNLKWVSKVENAHHRRWHGTHPGGENHPRAKLTAADVSVIRQQIAAGSNCTEIGRRFGVHNTTIQDIMRGRKWRSLKHESAVTNEVRQTPTTSPSSPSIELDQ